jgi:hypothetical protein
MGLKLGSEKNIRIKAVLQKALQNFRWIGEISESGEELATCRTFYAVLGLLVSSLLSKQHMLWFALLPVDPR